MQQSHQPTLLSPPGQPYQVAELLRKCNSSSPREMYVALCRKCDCKHSDFVASTFPEKPNSWAVVEQIDLSKTYVGPKGLLPIIELCKLLPNLKALNVSDNYLTNETVWHLCKMALYHPSLRALDLSRNAISWTAAMSLTELVTQNDQIQRVILAGTAMTPPVMEAIQHQVLTNASMGMRRQRRGPNPCNHPTTIRQRALKRYFHEIADATEHVHRSKLPDGLREMWQMSGRESTQRTPLFFDSFSRRAPHDAVNWETFLILVMLEDVLFNESFVQRLRTVFDQFDVDHGGYVDAREMKAMMTAVSPTQTSPPDDEVRRKMALYDLDETMTLNWDEFLLLMYDQGPVLGEKAITKIGRAHV